MNFVSKAYPLVSVIIPTFNRDRVLKRAVWSVLNQTNQRLEIIIVDDGSKEEVVSAVRTIEKIDARIRCIYFPVNRGAQAARNAGIRAAVGEWIGFLDSDDIWLPDFLKTVFDVHNKTGRDVVHGGCYLMREGRALRALKIPQLSGDVYKSLLLWPGPLFPGLMVKRRCLDQIGHLDESIIAYQEWDTSIRLSRHCQFAFVNRPLFIYDLHDGWRISKDMRRDADGWAQIVAKHKDEILENWGEQGLCKHYSILGIKYYHGGERGRAAEFFHAAAMSSNPIIREKYRLQAKLAKAGVTPGLLNFEKIIRLATERLIKMHAL